MEWIIERRHIRDEDGGTVAVELSDKSGWMRAHVRWDGGMQIWLDNVTEEQNVLHDSFHTYDIRLLIERLQDLQKASEELFGHEGYWSHADGDDSLPDLSYYPDETSRGGATPPP